MRKLGIWMLRGVGALALAVALAFVLAPKDRLPATPAFDAARFGDNLDAYLAQSEGQVPKLRAGAQKRIVWARGAGVKTPLSIVYLHGFSATSREISPVPEQLAAALGANLYLARLTGHGQDGAAMATASVAAWMSDASEAMAIGRAIGQRVIVIGTSTGATLAHLAAFDENMRAQVAGLVYVSPNFGVRSVAGKILDMPFADVWGPWVAGANRSFTPINAEHAAAWTTSYPTKALFPMAELVRLAKSTNPAAQDIPLLALYSVADQVVSPEATAHVLADWGGPIQIELREMTPSDDPYAHVIAGNILSPAQTAGTLALIAAWARKL